MTKYDVAVIGAGHNALTSACYLAKAGKKVVVLERRPVIGGAACTEEMFGGYKVDIGSSIHVLFPTTGIAKDLELEKHGLEYIELDPWGFYPIKGTDKAITFYRSLDKTCESIAAISPRDAETYRDFMTTWGDVQRLIWPAMSEPPSMGQTIASVLKTAFTRPGAVRTALKSDDLVRQVLIDSRRLLEELFESEELKAALMWLGAQNGPHPDTASSATILGHYGMIHDDGAFRAIGGSGMVSVALGRALEGFGGTILTDAEVERVVKTGDGFEVRAGDMAVTAENVLFGCHVQTALLKLLDPDLVDPGMARRLKALKVMNGSGFMIRQAVSELPAYAGQALNEHGVGECHHGMQLLCPSVQTLTRSTNLGRAGRPPEAPPVMQMSFTAVDPSLAPEGKHLLYSWSSYHPYHLDGENWDDIAEREADKIWDVVCDYTPNMKGKLIDRYIQTPLDIERVIGMVQGDVTHLEMSMDQMLSFRPLPDLSGYKTPIEGVYLTGASTHPGGGVWGASGRSAAKVMLKNIK
ncbi:MAG: FAD-dependent oxidoreductase [Confluentimicrobium sp.]|uniref:phytoene desaturase family protein n=1 Tax=Actibacterium sp. TaxID=1872125 RepID=UPI000C3BDAEA|nr:NAD(P)/FAD-dependent oxidoreductase [Actibacterium sp.]MBC57602.1 FAD-dependent oxidoreductase [Actibacterium sp.]